MTSSDKSALATALAFVSLLAKDQVYAIKTDDDHDANDDKAQNTSDEKPSSVNINSHKQHEAFEDADHDMIEDLSVDPVLEAAEKKEAVEESTLQKAKPVGGSNGNVHDMRHPMISGMQEEETHTEETTDSDGHKITKTVHSGPGWKSVEISSDGPMNIGDMIGKMMQE